MRMRIDRRVLVSQQSTLEYMKSIGPVWQTVEDLIKAVLLTKKSKEDSCEFPEVVRDNKAFDGHHEGKRLEEFLVNCKCLRLRVFRDYLGNETVEEQLEKSNRFHVAFVRVDDEGRPYGHEFTVFRNGALTSRHELSCNDALIFTAPQVQGKSTLHSCWAVFL